VSESLAGSTPVLSAMWDYLPVDAFNNKWFELNLLDEEIAQTWEEGYDVDVLLEKRHKLLELTPHTGAKS
jgi:hypothetical protein